MQQNMSANGSRPLPFISGRSWRKASITMLLCLTPQGSSFACSTILKLRARSTFHKLSLEPELTNIYCISRRSCTSHKGHFVQQTEAFRCYNFSKRGRIPALLSCSLRRPRCLFSASVCCLSRAAHFFTQSSFWGLTFNS